MFIEHIAIYYKDLEKAKDFFEKYFFAKCDKKYTNPNTNFESYFLTFEDGSRLEIMTRPELHQNEKNLFSLGLTHIAFSMDTEDDVKNLFKKLKNDGYIPVSKPRTTGDGYFEAVIRDFENNLIELTYWFL